LERLALDCNSSAKSAGVGESKFEHNDMLDI